MTDLHTCAHAARSSVFYENRPVPVFALNWYTREQDTHIRAGAEHREKVAQLKERHAVLLCRIEEE